MNADQKAALKKIFDAGQAGLLGAVDADSGCVYHDRATGQNCAIGALLPEAIHAEIDALCLNEDTSVSALIDSLKEHGISADLYIPFSREQAKTLQSWHDQAYTNNSYDSVTPEEFLTAISLLIAGEISAIRMHPTDSKTRLIPF